MFCRINRCFLCEGGSQQFVRPKQRKCERVDTILFAPSLVRDSLTRRAQGHIFAEEEESCDFDWNVDEDARELNRPCFRFEQYQGNEDMGEMTIISQL